ncbi:hypothetical protein CDAR_393101 [Caerostris darwini]|uniref:Uncharacterized protein n=1 Tax=Caerostris darwini TaxID=1538125 RepID=A0AAV4RVQ5_9ARAC|nr:hypothetical protein CDAR_393101 [Caerostris darwini]
MFIKSLRKQYYSDFEVQERHQCKKISDISEKMRFDICDAAIAVNICCLVLVGVLLVANVVVHWTMPPTFYISIATGGFISCFTLAVFFVYCLYIFVKDEIDEDYQLWLKRSPFGNSKKNNWMHLKKKR